MIETIGWVGGIMLGVCAMPQAYKSWKTGKAEDFSSFFLLFWLIGEICSFIYIWPNQDWPLLTNYLLNITAIYVIIRTKLV